MEGGKEKPLQQIIDEVIDQLNDITDAVNKINRDLKDMQKFKASMMDQSFIFHNDIRKLKEAGEGMVKVHQKHSKLHKMHISGIKNNFNLIQMMRGGEHYDNRNQPEVDAESRPSNEG